jgi:pyruvate/2-oxoglutarate dehydrogenase complex dihydrolipoamide dehydrogenase (E3) component
MARWDYDVIVLGLGPAGMAVSVMGSEMGLKVCAVEKHKIGGECMNVGCIPSKALLKTAELRHHATKMKNMALGECPELPVGDVFKRIRNKLQFINDTKTSAMFRKVDLVLNKGPARFVDTHTVMVGERTITAKRIFICTGTKPAVPPIPGIETIDILTNENIFSLDDIPESMVIIGGGAIGCEMAQAFARLGSKISLVHMDEHLMPVGDKESGEYLQQVFESEGIKVYNGRKLSRVAMERGRIVVTTDRGETLTGEKLLVAAGRRAPLDELNLEAAQIDYTAKGIVVNNHLQTSQPNIYAAGDCNGHFLLTHAAMHQGMLALINSILPKPFRKNFKKYVVPWTVFTDPKVSHVGKNRRELAADNVRFEEVTARYADYGAAIAEGIDTGYVKAFISPTGRILGAQIVGEGSGEMINEWGLAIQKKLRITDIMFLQHSFPSMSFLTKRVSETWMMNRMKSAWIKKLIRWMF